VGGPPPVLLRQVPLTRREAGDAAGRPCDTDPARWRSPLRSVPANTGVWRNRPSATRSARVGRHRMRGTRGGGGGFTGRQPRPSFTPREGTCRSRTAAGRPTADGVPPAGACRVSAAGRSRRRMTTRRPRLGLRRVSPRSTAVPQQDDADNRTRVLEPDESGLPSTGPQRITDNTSPNLARSSNDGARHDRSRGTGFLRTLVLVVALGGGTLRTRTTTPTRCEHRVLPHARGIFTFGRVAARPGGQGGSRQGEGTRSGFHTRRALAACGDVLARRSPAARRPVRGNLTGCLGRRPAQAAASTRHEC